MFIIPDAMDTILQSTLTTDQRASKGMFKENHRVVLRGVSIMIVVTISQNQIRRRNMFNRGLRSWGR